MLPLEKTPYEQQVIHQRANRRRKLMEAARDGDEQAMQTITMEDMDTYGDLLGKIQNNDILTLVDSFFMPRGQNVMSITSWEKSWPAGGSPIPTHRQDPYPDCAMRRH